MTKRQGRVIADELRRRGLRQKDLAKRMNKRPDTVSRYINSPAQIKEDIARLIAKGISADTAEEQALVDRLCRVRGGARDDDSIRMEVRALEYGHLKMEELTADVTPAARLGGPTGFLITLFRRFAGLAGSNQLIPRQHRTGLSAALASTAGHHVYLGNLATIPRLVSDYLFCTPISIAVQGLIRLEDSPERDTRLREAIREALVLQSETSKNLISPVYMPQEIGANVVRAALGERDSAAPVNDLSIPEYLNAFVNVDAVRTKRVVLFADELTCLLTLGECGDHPAALAFPDTLKCTRYPFGISIPRGNDELRRWFKVAWEFYIQSDAPFITERYLELYEEFVAFAKQLNKKSPRAEEDHIKEPTSWAAGVLGVDIPQLRSTLVNSAWQPIVDSVYRKIH